MEWEEFNALSEDQKQSEFVKIVGKLSQAQKESIDGRKTLKSELETAQSALRTTLDKLGLDDIADLDKLPDAKGMAEAQKQVEAKLKRLERELSEAQKSATDKDGSLKGLRADMALREAMSKHQFIDDELVGMMIKSKLTHDNDAVFYTGDDGSMLSLPDALAGIAKARPHLVKAPANGGSGFTGGNSGNNGGFVGKTVTADQISAMSPSEYQQFSVSLSSGQVQLAS